MIKISGGDSEHFMVEVKDHNNSRNGLAFISLGTIETKKTACLSQEMSVDCMRTTYVTALKYFQAPGLKFKTCLFLYMTQNKH